MNPFDTAIVPPEQVPGRPTGNNPFALAADPAPVLAPRIMAESLAADRPWQHVEPMLKEAGADPAPLRQQYQLDTERKAQRRQGVGVLEQIGRASIPFLSEVRNADKADDYTAALARFHERKATDQDIKTIARFERLQEIDRDMASTTGGAAVQALGAVPKIVGEAYGAGKVLGGLGRAVGIGKVAAPPLLAAQNPGLAGQALGFAGRQAAVTPLMPSMYLQHAVETNIAQGRSATDPKGLPPALALGFANNLVLGSLQKAGGGAPGGLIGRSVTKGGVGVYEQSLVDAFAGAADEHLPDAYKMGTKYGVMGQIARGEGGDALKSATVQALTFSVFAGLHDRGPMPAVKAFKELVDASPTPAEAAKSAATSHAAVADALKEPAKAAEIVKRIEDPAAKEYAGKLIETVVKPTESAPPKHEPSAEQGVGGDTVTPPTPSTSERPAGERGRLSEPNPLPVQKKPLGPVEALPPETQADMAKQLGVSVKELVKRQSEPLIAGLAAEAAKPPSAGLPPLPGSKTAPSAEVPAAAKPEPPRGFNPEDVREAREKMAELNARGGVLLPAARPKTAFEQRNAVRSEQAQGSLLKVVRDHGGIDPTDAAFLAHYESKQRAIEDGIPASAFKVGGRGLDQIAQELGPHDPTTGLKGGGYIPDASPETVLRMLKEKTPHRHAEQSATHEKALEEYHRRMQEEADAAPKEPASESDETGLTGDVGDFDFSHAENAAATLLASKIAENTPQGGVSTAMANQIPAAPLRPTLRAQIKDAATSFAHNVVDMARKLGGATAPKTSRLSAATGDAIGRFGTARVYATELASHLVDRVMGKHTSDTVRRLVGGVITEMRLRHMRETFLEKGRLASNEGVAFKNAGKAKEAAEAFGRADEYGKKARGVKTIIGGKTHDEYLTNPLESEQSYQAALRDPVVKEVLARYKAEAVSVMEDAYRRAQGIVEGEEIDTETQLPGMPFTLKAVREGEAVPGAVMMGGRGNLANPKLFRLGASREATGAATHGYDIDLGNIIENMAGQRVPAAAKAELYRTAEADGVGMWAKPGERPDPLTWKKIDRVAPPKGTQANADGATDFYVKLSAHGELRQVLAPDEPAMKLPGMAASTWAALVSTVEAASHTKNLLTQLTRPGMNPLDVIRSARDLIYRDPAAMREVVELARVGAMREHGADTGMLYGGKLDPTAWTGRFLTLVDRSMRLASGKAFDRLVERGWVKDTEGARRDFVNQIGNYSKRTQNRVVAWLRDTGVGPFATAATNFAIHGLRSALVRPGVKGQTWKADLKLRAEMLGRLALLPAVAAVTNYVTTGRVDGDDNTPVGAMWLGKSDGKTSYLDLTALTGLSRGWRETGMLAMAEGMRPGAKAAGATPGTSADKAVKDIARSALHPAFGPPVAFGHTAITGENIFGTPVANKAAKGESQAANNALAAFWSSNPLLEAWIKPAVEELAETRKTPGQVRREGTAGERFMKTFGPFGLKTGRQPPGKPMPK